MAAGESINQQAPRLAPLLCLCCELINRTPMLAEARGQDALTVQWCRASGCGGGSEAVDPCRTHTCSLAASGQSCIPFCVVSSMECPNISSLLAYCKQELVSNMRESNCGASLHPWSHVCRGLAFKWSTNVT